MENDTQVIHHLWWLRRFLQNHFGDKEYKDVIRQELDSDTIRELHDIVLHINNEGYIEK